MPPKKGLPPPIDRPLAKAYLREFTGWSCAYPPGISDPTSLRDMENIFITREGAASIRPALRSIFEDDVFLNTTFGLLAASAFEPFYTNAGTKALLFAVRENISGVDKIGFRCALWNSTLGKFEVKTLTDPLIGFSIPQTYETLCFDSGTTYVKFLQIDNKIFALSDNASGTPEPMREFLVGTTKVAKKLQKISVPNYNTADRPNVVFPDDAWIAGSQVTVPTAETTLTTSTLVSSTASANTYNFGYFYTYNNDVGESPASMVFVIKVQRGWSNWNVNLTDVTKSADQLVTIIPTSSYNQAIADGATSWNLYAFTWSDEAPVPTEAVLLKTISLVNTTYAKSGWASHVPLLEGTNNFAALPNASNRYNYSDPGEPSQGLVAGDRMVVVNDKTEAAKIRWTSNQQGQYTNFSSSVGGGYKTLTSGNLYVPACAVLWQNPQSVDTVTILCLGTDGYSTSYYMTPNTTVTSQSQSTTIMAFEETTATQGTSSPYGCTVLNNALYHPLDYALVKSTASNYNINHKTMTDLIQNVWMQLSNKYYIIVEHLDNRLYYIVDNPRGPGKDSFAKGNEIWVYDTAAGESGTWSRLMISAVSLRRLEMNGKLYMAVIQTDGIYVLDDLEVYDTYNADGSTLQRPITWKLETNTQGANRAHDAWAHLQQANVTVGNFYGTMRYGIRGWDLNGKQVEVSKQFRALDYDPLLRAVNERITQSDLDDYLLIRRDLKEWRFFAESLPYEGEPSQGSYGQINLVQYRFTPVSVNVGYEYGSIETFEYGRASVNWAQRTTDNGVPIPVLDTRRP